MQQSGPGIIVLILIKRVVASTGEALKVPAAEPRTVVLLGEHLVATSLVEVQHVTAARGAGTCTVVLAAMGKELIAIQITDHAFLLTYSQLLSYVLPP